MKKLLLLLSFITPNIINAVTFDVNGIRYEILSQDDKTVSVAIKPKSLSYPTTSTYSGSVSIPSSVVFNETTYSVIEIGKYAFNDCYNLTDVVIPSSIKIIRGAAFAKTYIYNIEIPESVEILGDGVFSNCSNLTEITIPASVSSIGSSLFSGCSKLKSITFLNDSYSEIPDYTFSGCSSLESFSLGSQITSLGEAAFMYTTNLLNLDIPNSVNFIGQNCFLGCGVTSLNIPDGISSLPGAMFAGCKNLSYIKLPSNLSQLEPSMFNGARSLTAITIPDGVMTIPERCFYGCWNLANVSLPNSIKYIYRGAFSDCRVLDNVILPEGLELLDMEVFFNSYINNIELPSTLKTIGGWCFGIGPDMRTLKLPISLTHIGSYAFDSGNVQEIICMNPEPIACESNVFKNETYYGTLYVPKGCLEAYKAVKPWSDFFTIKEHNYSGLNDVSFEGNGTVISYISINGIPGNYPSKGLNIVQFSDGSVSKIYVK